MLKSKWEKVLKNIPCLSAFIFLINLITDFSITALLNFFAPFIGIGSEITEPIIKNTPLVMGLFLNIILFPKFISYFQIVSCWDLLIPLYLVPSIFWISAIVSQFHLYILNQIGWIEASTLTDIFPVFKKSMIDIWLITEQLFPPLLLQLIPELRMLRPFVFVIGFIFFLLFGYLKLYGFKESIVSVAISIFMVWGFNTLVSSGKEAG